MRRINVRRDLLPVADLIQLCFGDQMDADGQEYLRQMHQTARDGSYFRWMPGAGEMLSYPLDGYVWEEDQKIVANLTLLPFSWRNKWIYMVVNVAVHPAYRRKGIARQLTQQAIQHARQHHVSAVWLQVRDDNESAIALYLSLGFQPRCKRSTWQNITPYPQNVFIPPEVEVFAGTPKDWKKQESWLNNTYPEEVAWNFAFHTGRFKPSFLNRLTRWLNADEQRHWTALLDGKLIGTAIWEPGRWSADTIWLGAETDYQDYAIRALLPTVRHALGNKRPCYVNYPAGQATHAFESAGFALQNTLIWMSIELTAH